jgi:hypothetical protein
METEMDQNGVVRLFVVAPPLLAALASLPVIVVSFFAWGVASGSGYPAALPTVAGLMAGVPALLLGLYTWRTLRTRMVFNYRMVLPFALLNSLAYTGLAFFLLLLSTRIGDRATYHGLRPDEISSSALLATVTGAPLAAFAMIACLSLLLVLTTTPGIRPELRIRESRPDPFAR